jgi:hypothetical protein
MPLTDEGSGAAACSFHFSRGNRRAWITASRLLEKQGRYQALVVVNEW